MKRSFLPKVMYSMAMICLVSGLLLAQPSYKTVKLDITFTTDWGVIEHQHAYYHELDFPRGFREASMRLTMNGSLSHFSVSKNQIFVTKYSQYDTFPVRLEIHVDIPENQNQVIFYTNQGGAGSTEGKIYSLTGQLLGVFSDTGGRPPQEWKRHIISFTSTSIDTEPEKVTQNFELQQNYPNPFNPATNINFSVQKSSQTRLTIYNSLGQLVRVLVDEVKSAGEYTIAWDGMDENKHKVASGTYFYQIQADDFISTKKMIMIK